jgi:adenylate cyclase
MGRAGAVSDEVDFAAEGLLDGLEGPARDGRLTLLRELHDDGVPLAELHDAVAEERLALLPVERLLGGEPRFSATELADRAGIDPELFAEALAALGMPATGAGDRRFGDADLEGARRLRTALDSGLPADRIVDVNRVIGRAMAQVAAAIHSLVGETYLHAGDTEDVVAARYAAAAQALLPTLGPTLEHAFALHLRELLRGDTIDAATLRTGALAGSERLAVAFADLVGFTWLGGTVPPEELGRVARRLEALARDVALPPVRLVKLIGDAVMLVSPDPAPLLDAVLALVDAAAAEGEGFPHLRAGVALGTARERDGDVYGHAVNVASRLTAIARPGSVLADEHVHEALGERVAWSFAGERRVRGLADDVRLFRARRHAVG